MNAASNLVKKALLPFEISTQGLGNSVLALGVLFLMLRRDKLAVSSDRTSITILMALKSRLICLRTGLKSLHREVFIKGRASTRHGRWKNPYSLAITSEDSGAFSSC